MTPAMKAKMEELARSSTPRHLLELHEADARERHFKAGFTAAVELMQERERVALQALEKVQAHGLHHYEDCKNREYDDQLCNCGMEKAEIAVMNAISKLKSGGVE